MDCLFCKILNGEIPSKKVYEDDLVYAFHDIKPEAPVHVLVISKEHIDCANDITTESSAVLSRIFEAIAIIARQEGIAEDGYRIVNNCGKNGLQSVNHLHFHVLGGRMLGSMG